MTTNPTPHSNASSPIFFQLSSSYLKGTGFQLLKPSFDNAHTTLKVRINSL